MKFVCLSSALLMLLAPLRGTTLQQLSMDDLIRKSSTIVRGKVKCTGSGFQGSTVYTYYQIQVNEQWKGAAASKLDIAVPGGSVNGVRQTYAGAPTLGDGQEFVVFLWTGKSGLRQVIGLSQGLFSLTQTGNGPLTAVRSAASQEMVGPNGSVVHDSDFSMPLTDLRSKVATTLAGRASQ